MQTHREKVHYLNNNLCILSEHLGIHSLHGVPVCIESQTYIANVSSKSCQEKTKRKKSLNFIRISYSTHQFFVFEEVKKKILPPPLHSQ